MIANEVNAREVTVGTGAAKTRAASVVAATRSLSLEEFQLTPSPIEVIEIRYVVLALNDEMTSPEVKFGSVESKVVPALLYNLSV